MTLKEIIEALEMSNDELDWYYDPDQDTLIMASDAYEDGEYILSRDEAEERDLIPLPSEYEIHEYRIIQDFVATLPDELYDIFDRKIHGKGAFRRFKDTLYHLGIEEQWYRYREEALLAIAQQWIDQYKIPIDKPNPST